MGFQKTSILAGFVVNRTGCQMFIITYSISKLKSVFTSQFVYELKYFLVDFSWIILSQFFINIF